MAQRESQDTRGAAAIAAPYGRGAAGIWLPSRPPGEKAGAPQTLISEGMNLVASGEFSFVDPVCGPVTFQLSVWRHRLNELPEYEVVVE